MKSKTLEPGDRLLVSELSRLGRSLSQVIQIVETLVRRKIRFIAIKEAIEFDGKQDLRTKVMIVLFGLFAEVERDLISERTKEAVGEGTSMDKTGIRELLNSPIPYSGPLDSAPGPAPTTRGILQNLPATPSPGNPLAMQVREGRPARESGEDSPTVS